MSIKNALLAGGALLLVTTTARAEVIDYSGKKDWYKLSEVSLGAGKTDIFRNIEASPDVTGELMLQPIGNSDWYEELRVRPTFGLSVNNDGKTSYAYTGANFDLLNFEGFYVDGFFGLSVHDGDTHPNARQRLEHRALGSRAEFRSAATLGYQFTPMFGTSIFIDHQSNAGIFDKINQGIETAGVRFSYTFP